MTILQKTCIVVNRIMVAIAPIGAFPTLGQTAALQQLSRQLEQIARRQLGLSPAFDVPPVFDPVDEATLSPEARALAATGPAALADGVSPLAPAPEGLQISATLFPQVFAEPFDTTGFPIRLRLALADAEAPLQFAATAETALALAERGPAALVEEAVEIEVAPPTAALAPEAAPAAAAAPVPAPAQVAGVNLYQDASDLTPLEITNQQAAGAAILAGEFGLVASQIENQYARGEGSDLLVQTDVGGVTAIEPYPDINAYRPDLVEPTAAYLTAQAVIEARHAAPGFETASVETRTAAAGVAPGVTPGVTARQAVAAYTAG